MATTPPRNWGGSGEGCSEQEDVQLGDGGRPKPTALQAAWPFLKTNSVLRIIFSACLLMKLTALEQKGLVQENNRQESCSITFSTGQ